MAVGEKIQSVVPLSKFANSILATIVDFPLDDGPIALVCRAILPLSSGS